MAVNPNSGLNCNKFASDRIYRLMAPYQASIHWQFDIFLSPRRRSLVYRPSWFVLSISYSYISYMTQIVIKFRHITIYLLSTVTIRYISHWCYFERCCNCFSKHTKMHSRPIMHRPMCIEFAKKENGAVLPFPRDARKLQCFQLQRGGGFAPWPPPGALPLDSAGASAPRPL